MASNGKISLRQAMFLFLVITFTPALRIIPIHAAAIAKQASWLAPFLSFALALPVIFALKSIYSKHQDKSFTELLEIVFGRFIGKTVTLVYILFYIRLPEGNTLFETDHNDFRLPKAKSDLLVQHYFDSLDFSRSAHEMLAILGGKAPHNHGVFIGGATSRATIENVGSLKTLAQNIRQFIISKMIPDAYTIADYFVDYFEYGQGYANFLSYGCFDRYEKLGTLFVDPLVYSNGVLRALDSYEITENIHTSWYAAKNETSTPFETVPEPDMNKSGGYSWVKAPRYGGIPCEVGPLARMWLCGDYRNGISTMDRTLARVLEAKKLTDIILTLINNLALGVDVQKEYEIPQSAYGAGLTDTTRGALGHWLRVEDGAIAMYQIITPSTWNLSTRSQDNLPGPCERALIGTSINKSDSPVELGRIIRSFDPCVSCATHVYSKGTFVKSYKVVP